MSRLRAVIARHTGRHCSRGTFTGWGGLGRLVPPSLVVELRRDVTPLGWWPMAKFDPTQPELIPATADHTQPMERAS